MNVGIVCEFNPFHNGHAYLIAKSRELTGGNVVCAISSNFVQRGEYAFADKYTRAKWAVSAGADIVLENPFPFSCATAEKFALGAVKILVGSNLCDALSFGCEDEVTEEMLYFAASALLSKDFEGCVKERIKENKALSYAKARQDELEARCGNEIASLVSSPNSLLAVEYAKACLTFGKKPRLFPITRMGAMHDGGTVGSFANGSTLRVNYHLSEKYCPYEVARHLIENGGTIVNNEKYYAALSARILYDDKASLSKTAELPAEYAHKLKKSVTENESFDGFFESLKAKHITDAKLRRMLVYLLTKTEKSELLSLPESAMLLAVSENGAKILKAYKKSEGDFAVLSKLSDIKKQSDTERARYEKQLLAEKLFEKLL